MPRLPLSAVLVPLILAGMFIGVVDPALQAQIVDVAAMTWSREAALELWRTPLSPLIQEDPGFSWLILVLLPALPLAELRWGAGRTAVGFFFSDAVATLVPLAVLGAWHAFALPGATSAAAAAAEPNVGSSAGLYALVAALITDMPRRWPRLAAILLLAGVLLGYLLVNGELADVQHVVGVAAGVVVAVTYSRRDARRDEVAGVSPAAEVRTDTVADS